MMHSTEANLAHGHSGGPAVTAFMDEMALLHPVHVGDIVRTRAQVNWVGTSPAEERRLREAEIRRHHRLARKTEIESGRSAP